MIIYSHTPALIKPVMIIYTHTHRPCLNLSWLYTLTLSHAPALIKPIMIISATRCPVLFCSFSTCLNAVVNPDNVKESVRLYICGRGLHRGPDPGPVRVRVYILNGQPGPGRVPIYYFGCRVCLTLCVIPELIGEHRTCQWSVSVGTLCVFCNLQLVKLGWEKYERK